MEITTSWGERAERNQTQKLLLKQLTRRVGEMPESMTIQILALPNERLEQLAVDLLDFSGIADLEKWLVDPQDR